ncbi:hypothetical protein ACFLQI_01190 [Candidatus Undinarchaeota archaeon]
MARAKITKGEIQDKIAEGWIHMRSMIEVQGNNEAHIEKSLKDMVDLLKKEKGFALIEETYDKTQEIEGKDKWYSTMVDIELMVNNFENLTKFSTQFSPSSLEILAPKEFNITAQELQNTMLSISALITTFAQAAYLARVQLKQVAAQLPVEKTQSGDKPKK